MDKRSAEHSEEALMESYVKGDQDAFRQLFRALAPQVHGFFLRRFGSPAVADDMLQTTFLKLHRARHEYRVGLPVRPWLFTIAARVRFDELRRRGRHPETGDPVQMERATAGMVERSSGADLLEREEIAQKVREALAELPESQRLVVQLHRYEGFTFDQIAGILDTTEGAVKLRAFRAYERLRKQLMPVLGENSAGGGAGG